MKKIFLILILTFPIFTTTASDKSIYDFHWLDPEKVVYVLQNKVFEKQNTFYANLGYGSSITSDFQDTTNYQFKMGWHFLEEWGIEALYSQVANADSQTLKNISASTTTTTVPFVRRFNSYYALMAIFSPFYAKINTFNKIFYFDWNFGLGLVKIDGESNSSSFRNEDATNPFNWEKESYTGFVYKTSLRFYISELYNVNLDLLRMHYQAESPLDGTTKKYYGNTDVVFSFGISI